MRCVGFTSDDGAWARCSREEKAGGLTAEDGAAGAVYAHRIGGPCRCGLSHGEGLTITFAPTSGKAPEHPEVMGWNFRHPIPDGAPPRPWEAIAARVPDAVYAWTDTKGRPCFYTVRFVWDDAGRRRKVVTPRTVWERQDGSLVWAKVGPPAGWRRPLFNLPAIAADSASPVIVVEGEKAANAAASRVPGHIVTTWHGGCGAAHLTDWRPLAGREVVVWPDADEQGAKAADAVARACREAGAGLVRLVKLPPGLPRGWDLADPWPAEMEAAPWKA